MHPFLEIRSEEKKQGEERWSGGNIAEMMEKIMSRSEEFRHKGQNGRGNGRCEFRIFMKHRK